MSKEKCLIAYEIMEPINRFTGHVGTNYIDKVIYANIQTSLLSDLAYVSMP